MPAVVKINEKSPEDYLQQDVQDQTSDEPLDSSMKKVTPEEPLKEPIKTVKSAFLTEVSDESGEALDEEEDEEEDDIEEYPLEEDTLRSSTTILISLNPEKSGKEEGKEAPNNKISEVSFEVNLQEEPMEESIHECSEMSIQIGSQPSSFVTHHVLKPIQSLEDEHDINLEGSPSPVPQVDSVEESVSNEMEIKPLSDDVHCEQVKGFASFLAHQVSSFPTTEDVTSDYSKPEEGSSIDSLNEQSNEGSIEVTVVSTTENKIESYAQSINFSTKMDEVVPEDVEPAKEGKNLVDSEETSPTGKDLIESDSNIVQETLEMKDDGSIPSLSDVEEPFTTEAIETESAVVEDSMLKVDDKSIAEDIDTPVVEQVEKVSPAKTKEDITEKTLEDTASKTEKDVTSNTEDDIAVKAVEDTDSKTEEDIAVVGDIPAKAKEDTDAKVEGETSVKTEYVIVSKDDNKSEEVASVPQNEEKTPAEGEEDLVPENTVPEIEEMPLPEVEKVTETKDLETPAAEIEERPLPETAPATESKAISESAVPEVEEIHVESKAQLKESTHEHETKSESPFEEIKEDIINNNIPVSGYQIQNPQDVEPQEVLKSQMTVEPEQYKDENEISMSKNPPLESEILHTYDKSFEILNKIVGKSNSFKEIEDIIGSPLRDEETLSEPKNMNPLHSDSCTETSSKVNEDTTNPPATPVDEEPFEVINTSKNDTANSILETFLTDKPKEIPSALRNEEIISSQSISGPSSSASSERTLSSVSGVFNELSYSRDDLTYMGIAFLLLLIGFLIQFY